MATSRADTLLSPCVLVVKTPVASREPVADRLAQTGRRLVGQVEAAAREQERTLAALQAALARLGRHAGHGLDRCHRRRRGVKARRALAAARLVISVGGDGTLLAASHWVTGAALLGVNSAPRSSVGYLTLTRRASLARDLARIAKGTLLPQAVSRIEVELEGKRLPPALNDVLLAHEQPAATSRYRLRLGRRAEDHRSSGLWVATAAGSTAGIRSAGGQPMPLAERRLQFRARELYRPRGSRAASWNPASWQPGQELAVESAMAAGWLFLDGARTAIRFPFGARAIFRASGQPLRLFADASRWAGRPPHATGNGRTPRPQARNARHRVISTAEPASPSALSRASERIPSAASASTGTSGKAASSSPASSSIPAAPAPPTDGSRPSPARAARGRPRPGPPRPGSAPPGDGGAPTPAGSAPPRGRRGRRGFSLPPEDAVHLARLGHPRVEPPRLAQDLPGPVRPPRRAWTAASASPPRNAASGCASRSTSSQAEESAGSASPCPVSRRTSPSSSRPRAASLSRPSRMARRTACSSSAWASSVRACSQRSTARVRQNRARSSASPGTGCPAPPGRRRRRAGQSSRSALAPRQKARARTVTALRPPRLAGDPQPQRQAGELGRLGGIRELAVALLEELVEQVEAVEARLADDPELPRGLLPHQLAVEALDLLPALPCPADQLRRALFQAPPHPA